MVQFLHSGGIMMRTAEGLRRYKPRLFGMPHMLAGGTAKDGLVYARGEGDGDHEVELPGGTRVAGLRADMKGDGVYTGDDEIDAANMAWRGQFRDGREVRVITVSLSDGGADLLDPEARRARVEIALDMAEELAAEYFPGSKYVAVAHIDRAHVHVHLVVENYDPVRGRRWSLTRYQCKKMQDLEWHKAGVCQPGKEDAKCRVEMLDFLDVQFAAGISPEKLIKEGRLVRLPADGHYDFDGVSFRPETLRKTGHLEVAARLGISLPPPSKMTDRREAAIAKLRTLLRDGQTRKSLVESKRLTVKDLTKRLTKLRHPSFTFDGVTYRADRLAKHGYEDIVSLLGLPNRRSGTYDPALVARIRRTKCDELDALLAAGRQENVSPRQVAQGLESEGRLSFVRALPDDRKLRNPALKYDGCRMRESTLRREGRDDIADLIRDHGAGTPSGRSDQDHRPQQSALHGPVPPPAVSGVPDLGSLAASSVLASSADRPKKRRAASKQAPAASKSPSPTPVDTSAAKVPPAAANTEGKTAIANLVPDDSHGRTEGTITVSQHGVEKEEAISGPKVLSDSDAVGRSSLDLAQGSIREPARDSSRPSTPSDTPASDQHNQAGREKKSPALPPIPILSLEKDLEWLDEPGVIFIGNVPDSHKHFGIPGEIFRAAQPLDRHCEYKAWLDGTSHADVEPDQREWILGQIPRLREAKALISFDKDLHGTTLIQKAFEVTAEAFNQTSSEQGLENPENVVLQFGPHFGQTLMQVDNEYLRSLVAANKGIMKNPVPMRISRAAAALLNRRPKNSGVTVVSDTPSDPDESVEVNSEGDVEPDPRLGQGHDDPKM